MSYTQGKWTVSRHDDNNDIVVRGEKEQIVANCTVDFIGGHPHGKEIQSNACLIAAAPDLLAACKYTIEKLRELKGKAFPVLPILQAIEKAK